MSIGKNIKRLRESRGLTQAELGKIAGVTDKAVSTWENGSADPRMGAIQKIADYFGVKKADILDDEDSSSLTELSDDERCLLQMFRSLNPAGKRRALQELDDLTQIERYIKIADNNCKEVG